ncbi:hypothetical protein AB4176_17785 [Vibrio splendidus]
MYSTVQTKLYRTTVHTNEVWKRVKVELLNAANKYRINLTPVDFEIGHEEVAML